MIDPVIIVSIIDLFLRGAKYAAVIPNNIDIRINLPKAIICLFKFLRVKTGFPNQLGLSRNFIQLTIETSRAVKRRLG